MKIADFLDKSDGFNKLTQKERVRLMSYFYIVIENTDEFTVKQITQCFTDNNLNLPANISREFTSLSESKPKVFIKRNKNFVFERSAKKVLDEIYLSNTHSQVISTTLRDLLHKVKSTEQKSFLEEAISCFEIKSYRASIVMSWLLAMDTIYEYIIKKKIVEFNSAIQLQGKYKKIIIATKDQFGEFKESDFIEILRVAKLISNDQRKILVEKLDFRNTCAHPNSIVIKESKAISFIEDIVENVIIKFN
jgi:hypothetical protein